MNTLTAVVRLRTRLWSNNVWDSSGGKNKTYRLTGNIIVALSTKINISKHNSLPNMTRIGNENMGLISRASPEVVVARTVAGEVESTRECKLQTFQRLETRGDRLQPARQG